MASETIIFFIFCCVTPNVLNRRYQRYTLYCLQTISVLSRGIRVSLYIYCIVDSKSSTWNNCLKSTECNFNISYFGIFSFLCLEFHSNLWTIFLCLKFELLFFLSRFLYSSIYFVWNLQTYILMKGIMLKKCWIDKNDSIWRRMKIFLTLALSISENIRWWV